MKQLFYASVIFVLAVSGCKKDDAGPTGSGGGGGATTPFEFITGRSWVYSGQSYDANATLIPSMALQSTLTVQTTGQTIGGIAQAAVLRLAYTQGTKSETGSMTVAYDQDRLLLYNGGGGASSTSPSFPGWNVLFDFSKDAALRTVLSFDSTYQLTLRSGGLLRDRVRYTATMRYTGEEPIPAFSLAGISCSKYLFTFTYDAVIDTGGVSLITGNVINATIIIWFSPSTGFVRLRGDLVTRVNLRSLNDLQIYHDAAFPYHQSPALTYYTINFSGGNSIDSFTLNARTQTISGYSIFDGLSKNF